VTPAHVPGVGLIGVSGYGRVHLQLARECRDRGEIAIVAATVINPTEEADTIAELRSHGTRIYHDYREMLRAEAGGLELCLIPTGIHWHARMTMAALQSGANVLVEKPLAGSMAEVEAVQEVERATGRFVAVGFQDLYDPATVWLKGALARGAIGRIESVRFLGVWPRARSYFGRNDWAGRIAVDGIPVLDSPLNNAFAHFVMLSQFFASAELDTAAVPQLDHVELWRAHAIENYDTAVVAAHTAQEVKLWFGVSHACAETIEPEIVIQGRDGMAWWRYENEACLRTNAGLEQRQAIPDTNQTRRAMLAAVLARLTRTDAPICGTALAARHVALIEAIQRHAAIQSFPSDAVRWINQDGSSVPEVVGLAAALSGAFHARQSLAAAGIGATLNSRLSS